MITEFLFIAGMAFVLGLFFVPVFIRIAIKIGWMDKPNARKIHQTPIALIGGVSIVFVTALTLSLAKVGHLIAMEQPVMLAGAVLLTIVGFIDDKMDISAKIKLVIQLLAAFAVAQSGVRIESLYGVFGIHDIPVWFQYILTVIVITGVTNAFNLMDGMDGLAGTLGTTIFIGLAWLAYESGAYSLMPLLLALIGATIAFLRFNMNPARLFMGDAGSLMIGFLASSMGVYLIQFTGHNTPEFSMTALMLVVTLFMIPVLDSLRVFRGRMKKGMSPFKADKTHLHHLCLLLGKNQRVVLVLITIILVTIMGLGFILLPAVGIFMTWAVQAFVFIIFSKLLLLNSDMLSWEEKIRILEDY
jgi:UDP-GlcNAc:undecaprenyl-phosphate GlcNAc-1-phosphate transferase